MLTQNLLTKTASRDWPNWIFLQGCCIVRCVILFSPLPLYVNVSFHVHFYMCVDVLYVMCVWQDLLHGRIQMKTLTNKWYEEVRQGPSGSEDDEDEAELLWTEQTLSVHKKTMNGHCVSWTEGVCVCVWRQALFSVSVTCTSCLFTCHQVYVTESLSHCPLCWNVSNHRGTSEPLDEGKSNMWKMLFLHMNAILLLAKEKVREPGHRSVEQHMGKFIDPRIFSHVFLL